MIEFEFLFWIIVMAALTISIHNERNHSNSNKSAEPNSKRLKNQKRNSRRLNNGSHKHHNSTDNSNRGRQER